MYTDDGKDGATGIRGPMPGTLGGSMSGPVYTGTSIPLDKGTVVDPRSVDAEVADTAVSARESEPRGAAGNSSSNG